MTDVAKAGAIHAAVSRLLANGGELRVGFDSQTNVPEIVEKLKSTHFKLPVFGRKEWIRRAVVTNPDVFLCLAPHVQLEMVYRGKWTSWDGYGAKIDREHVPGGIGPAGPRRLVVIQLGVDCVGFEGLLDGIVEWDCASPAPSN